MKANTRTLEMHLKCESTQNKNGKKIIINSDRFSIKSKPDYK